MKNIALYALLIPLLVTMVGAPMMASARGGDDDRYESRDEFDDEDEDDDRNDREDDSSDDSTDDTLEIEADVFTDMTIVKVEPISGKKTIFRTDATTRTAVVDAVVARFAYTRAEVEAVLDFEIEDRASRAKDRTGITGTSNTGGNGSTTVSTSSTATSSMAVTEARLTELRTRVAELQRMLEQLIALLRGN
ncbi:MAG: hypothetical protein RLZZ70_192 [Candidatus Parcubacteria bacterium]|jgi:hypothetical protein